MSTLKSLKLLIHYLDSVGSTQSYLKKLLKDKSVTPPVAVVAHTQTDGQGSRGNSWSSGSGDLSVSFAIERKLLADDLALESASIYFAYIFKLTLEELGSQCWLKWPNDLYLENHKIGGVITSVVDGSLVCGIGLNLDKTDSGFTALDISISKEKLLESFFANLEICPKWKEIFRQYSLEFYKNRGFLTHNNSHKISLSNATLCDNGSIEVDGQRIFSLR